MAAAQEGTAIRTRFWCRSSTGLGKKEVPAAGIHLRDIQYSACIGCEKCRKDQICTGLVDGMSVQYSEIHQARARGLVLVSPTHNYNIISWMKAFIDRLYCFHTFAETRPRAWSSRLAGQGRKAVLAAICEQEDQKVMGFTLEAMRLPLEALGYEIVGELPVFWIFDRGEGQGHCRNSGLGEKAWRRAGPVARNQ